MAPVSKLTELLAHPKVKGVCIGWCPDGDKFDGIDGHAHQDPGHGKRRGLICVASGRHYNATTIRHELAHIIRANRRHDDAYWRVVRELGGRKERRYIKEAN